MVRKNFGWSGPGGLGNGCNGKKRTLKKVIIIHRGVGVGEGEIGEGITKWGIEPLPTR